MAWSRPEYPRGRVDAAGECLAQSRPGDDLETALLVINNWRSSHSFPLQVLKMTLLKRARAVYAEALVAQRIKRIPAIHLKLSTNPNMKLSQMHDIGGCRAVMRTVSQVEKLVEKYAAATAKNPRRGGEFVKKYDYVSSPKPTGYRGVHLVYKYCSESRAFAAYNGLRIEIQIRSYYQHAWATAVETVDTFTAQALKSNIGQGSWKRFFALVSGAFALLENRANVPGVPKFFSEIQKELRRFSQEMVMLENFRKVTEQIIEKSGDVFLLELDSESRTTRTTGFSRNELELAQQRYLESEKQNKDQPTKQAVLVSVNSFKALRKAYPNYFLDISTFVALVRTIMRASSKS